MERIGLNGSQNIDETMVLSRKGKDGINYDGIIKEN